MSIEFVDPTMLTLPADLGGAVRAVLPETLAQVALAAGSESGGISGFLSSTPLGAQSDMAGWLSSGQEQESEAWFEIPASLAALSSGGGGDAPGSGPTATGEGQVSPIEAGPGLVASLANETEGEGGEGGDDDDGVTITGRRPPLPELPDDGTAGGGGGAGDGGSGGTGGESEQNDCRDRAALSASKDISNENDKDQDEHASVIYRDANGQVQRSPLIEGDSEGIPLGEILAWMAENGVLMNQVIGLLHNHPAWVYGATPELTALNRYPSKESEDGGDWLAAEYMVNRGAGGAGGANFALYLIDTVGDLREFAYSDRSVYESLSKSERKADKALPDELKDDGTSC